MIKQTSIAVIIASVLFLAPANAEPVNNVVNHPVPVVGKALTTAQIGKNILIAGLKRHWHMTEDGPNQLKAVQANARQQAIIAISYTGTSYSIRLVNSTGLHQNGDDISRRYNGWVRYLLQDIDDQLTRASLAQQ
jgi:hypothetical protein